MKKHVLISALIIVMTTVVTTGDAQQTDSSPAKSEVTPAEPAKKKVEPAIRFTPSEKIRADDAVSFPVDI